MNLSQITHHFFLCFLCIELRDCFYLRMMESKELELKGAIEKPTKEGRVKGGKRRVNDGSRSAQREKNIQTRRSKRSRRSTLIGSQTRWMTIKGKPLFHDRQVNESEEFVIMSTATRIPTSDRLQFKIYHIHQGIHYNYTHYLCE